MWTEITRSQYERLGLRHPARPTTPGAGVIDFGANR